MSELDAANRNRRVSERLESGHRRAASLDGPVVLLDEGIEILVCANLHIPPARVQLRRSMPPSLQFLHSLFVVHHYLEYRGLVTSQQRYAKSYSNLDNSETLSL